MVASRRDAIVITFICVYVRSKYIFLVWQDARITVYIVILGLVSCRGIGDL